MRKLAANHRNLHFIAEVYTALQQKVVLLQFSFIPPYFVTSGRVLKLSVCVVTATKLSTIFATFRILTNVALLSCHAFWRPSVGWVSGRLVKVILRVSVWESRLFTSLDREQRLQKLDWRQHHGLCESSSQLRPRGWVPSRLLFTCDLVQFSIG